MQMKDKMIVSYCMTCHKIRLPDGSWGVPEVSLDNYTPIAWLLRTLRRQDDTEARAEITKAKKIQWIIPALLGPFVIGESLLAKPLLLGDKFEYGIGGAK
jgi:hypothetical protein